MATHPVLLAFISAALFGAATPASKGLLTDLSPFQLAALLYLGAALGVAPVAGVRQVWSMPWCMNPANRWRLWGAILAGGVAGPVLLLAGLQAASAASVSLWLNLELVATAVLGHWFFRDHLTRYGWLGVVVTLSAAMTLSVESGSAGIMAGGLVLLACCCWGVDNHLTALIDGLTPSQSTFWKGLVAGCVNLAIGLMLHPFTATGWMLFGALLVGIWSYGVSITLYIHAAQQLGATRGQIIFSTAPLFGLLLSAMLLGEPLYAIHVIAALLFIVGIALLLIESHAHTHDHTALSHAHHHRHDDRHHTHDHDGLDPTVEHTHWHDHDSMTHAHAHWPDLHHRHGHD
jgi:drug/metabolite transporter (DMT)-like permease